jgi:type IV secretory pathway ATPase VirB11/archaellum biosynthesis ATPase
MENMARALNEAATEQAKLRGVTREMADFASTQIRGTIESAASQARQLLEDVQLSLHDAISGEAILKSYTDETRQQFAAVIKEIIEVTLVRALTLSQQRMDEWMKGTMDKSIRDAQKQEDFIGRLQGLDHIEVIREAIRARKNMLIVGGTGAGKTTIANAILEEIGTLTPGDRVLVIEDTQELLLDSANSLSMLATTEFDQLKCLKVALRLKPDRIIVGEVRDGAAALPLLKAWNTGHPGGVSTIHANSAAEALVRLEGLVREATEAPQQRTIGAAVDVVISVVNDPVEGRKVQEVAVVTGYQDGRYLLTQV